MTHTKEMATLRGVLRAIVVKTHLSIANGRQADVRALADDACYILSRMESGDRKAALKDLPKFDPYSVRYPTTADRLLQINEWITDLHQL